MSVALVPANGDNAHGAPGLQGIDVSEREAVRAAIPTVNAEATDALMESVLVKAEVRG